MLIAPIVNAQQSNHTAGVDWKEILLEDTTNIIHYIQLPEVKCNICDSITIKNPYKQNKGEFMLDFRNAIKTIDPEKSQNTRWIYDYGNTTENIWGSNFVPDTLVACISSQAINPTKCCSKWVWDGLSWNKQKVVTLKEVKYILDKFSK